MKVLFDNNVPAPLRRHLVGQDVHTAHEMSWHTLENGDLLSAAEDHGFDVLVTADQNLSYQQNLAGRRLALVVLDTNDWSVIREAPESVARAVDAAQVGSFRMVVFPRPTGSAPRLGEEA